MSSTDAPRYQERKEYTTQNILAASDFNIRFIYILPKWKGTASNSRIIKSVLSSEDKLIILRSNVKL